MGHLLFMECRLIPGKVSREGCGRQKTIKDIYSICYLNLLSATCRSLLSESYRCYTVLNLPDTGTIFTVLIRYSGGLLDPTMYSSSGTMSTMIRLMGMQNRQSVRTIKVCHKTYQSERKLI